MAERRMFAKSIVLSDAFLDMPMSARCLYFTLSMFADDDGFVGSPKAIMRQCGASQDDISVLIQKRFILGFESGVIAIKHWRMNNYLRNDRHHSTTYLEELSTLQLDEKNAYIEKENVVGIPLVYQRYTEDSKVKFSLDKCSRVECNLEDTATDFDDKENPFTPPTIEEVKAYCKERNNNIDAEQFVDFYQSKGWMVGKDKMKDWKASIRTWEKRMDKPKQDHFEKGYDLDEFEKMAMESLHRGD